MILLADRQEDWVLFTRTRNVPPIPPHPLFLPFPLPSLFPRLFSGYGSFNVTTSGGVVTYDNFPTFAVGFNANGHVTSVVTLTLSLMPGARYPARPLWVEVEENSGGCMPSSFPFFSLPPPTSLCTFSPPLSVRTSLSPFGLLSPLLPCLAPPSPSFSFATPLFFFTFPVSLVFLHSSSHVFLFLFLYLHLFPLHLHPCLLQFGNTQPPIASPTSISNHTQSSAPPPPLPFQVLSVASLHSQMEVPLVITPLRSESLVVCWSRDSRFGPTKPSPTKTTGVHLQLVMNASP